MEFSLVTLVTVHGAGGKDGVQMVTLEERGVFLFRDCFLCVLPRLMCVSVPVTTKKNKKYISVRSERTVLVLNKAHSTTCVVEMKNLADFARQKDKKRVERNRRFTW